MVSSGMGLERDEVTRVAGHGKGQREEELVQVILAVVVVKQRKVQRRTRHERGDHCITSCRGEHLKSCA